MSAHGALIGGQAKVTSYQIGPFVGLAHIDIAQFRAAHPGLVKQLQTITG